MEPARYSGHADPDALVTGTPDLISRQSLSATTAGPRAMMSSARAMIVAALCCAPSVCFGAANEAPLATQHGLATAAAPARQSIRYLSVPGGEKRLKVAVTADPVASAAPAPTCKTDLESQLETLNVPGLAAAVVKDSRIVCTATAGMANIEQNKRVTPNTLFLVASVSKTVTATALMQLYEERKFRLDDDVNRYLPFRVRIPAAPTAPITFRQLLTHTASIRDNETYIDCPGSCGYGSDFGPFITRDADSPISLADFTKGYLTPGGAYYDEDENFRSQPPGTVNRYSNMGIVLVGYLVEVMSRTPFDQYSRDHIFKPLQMDKTSWRLAGIDRSMLAMPYDKSSSGYVAYGQYGEPNYPDGMLRTSVNELAHFLMAYMQGGRHNGRQILRSSTIQEMLRNQTSLDSSQGLVWSSQSLGRWAGPRLVWGHDGSDFGSRARMWFDPAKKVGVILMSNGAWRGDRARALFASLFEEANGD